MSWRLQGCGELNVILCYRILHSILFWLSNAPLVHNIQAQFCGGRSSIGSDCPCFLLQVDKFLYSNEEYIKAGALMAVGMVHPV